MLQEILDVRATAVGFDTPPSADGGVCFNCALAQNKQHDFSRSTGTKLWLC